MNNANNNKRVEKEEVNANRNRIYVPIVYILFKQSMGMKLIVYVWMGITFMINAYIKCGTIKQVDVQYADRISNKELFNASNRNNNTK